MEILAVTIPILILVAMGYILKQKKIITIQTKDFLSKIVYYFAFPALTFRSIVSFDFSKTFKLKLVVHNLSVTLSIFIIAFLIAVLIKDRRKKGALTMGGFRSNQGYMGMPIVNGFYGEEAMSRAAVINGFDSPLVILLSVISLEIFRFNKEKKGNINLEENRKKSLVKLIKKKLLSFISNPFILSAVIGLLLSYLKVPVLSFKILDQFLKISAGMALPLALISIGCSLEIKHLKDNLLLVFCASSIKLIIAPIIAYLSAYFIFGFRGVDLGISIILLSTPTSVSSYIMASELESDAELTASIIGITTFLSIITISIIQYILKTYVL